MSEIIIKNKKVHYQHSGSGKGIILIHGFGENSNVFSRQMAALSQYYKVIVPDLPGSGFSEEADGELAITDFADIVFLIAKKELPGQKYSVFGHSMGGYITMAFIEKYSDHISTFGLLHSSAFPDNNAKKAVRKKGIDFINQHGGQAFIKTITAGLFSEESQKSHPEYIEELTSLGKNISDKSLVQYYKAMMNRDGRSHLLSTTALPVLFLIGKEDIVYPLRDSIEQSKLPPVKSVCLLEHSGHMGIWEEKDMANQAIISFLQEHI